MAPLIYTSHVTDTAHLLLTHSLPTAHTAHTACTPATCWSLKHPFTVPPTIQELPLVLTTVRIPVPSLSSRKRVECAER